jgi:hypothetical protein
MKLYDKREPNYFVILNKIIWQTRTKLFCNFPIKLYDKRELQNNLVQVCLIILLGITTQFGSRLSI